MRNHSVSHELEEDTKILTQFVQSALQAVRAKRGGAARGAVLGLSDRERCAWSWVSAINGSRPGPLNRKAGGFERECHTELAKRFSFPSDVGLAVPLDVLEHRLASPSYLVGVSAPSGLSFIDALRNRSLAFRLGAQRLPGLEDDVAIPRQTSNNSVTWLGSGGSVTATDAAFGQVSSTPRTASIITEVSEQLLRQSAAELIIPRGLASDLAVGIDAAVINGMGGVQPLGILNTPGIGSASGTTLAYTGLVGLQKTVADANAVLDPNGLAYATTPTVAELLKGRQRFTGTDSPLWRGGIHEGEVEGVRAVASKQTPASTLLFGDWSTVHIGEWGPLMLSTDNGGTRFNQGQVGIRALWMVDVFVTAPTAFVKVTSIT